MKVLYTFFLAITFISLNSIVALHAKAAEEKIPPYVEDGSGMTTKEEYEANWKKAQDKANAQRSGFSQRSKTKPPTNSKKISTSLKPEITSTSTQTSQYTQLTDTETTNILSPAMKDREEQIKMNRAKMDQAIAEHKAQLQKIAGDVAGATMTYEQASKDWKSARKAQKKASDRGFIKETFNLGQDAKEGVDPVTLTTAQAKFNEINLNLDKSEEQLALTTNKFSTEQTNFNKKETEYLKQIALPENNPTWIREELNRVSRQIKILDLTQSSTNLNSDILDLETKLNLLEIKFQQELVGMYISKKFHDLLDSKALCASVKSCFTSEKSECSIFNTCYSGQAKVNEDQFDILFKKSYKNLQPTSSDSTVTDKSGSAK